MSYIFILFLLISPLVYGQSFFEDLQKCRTESDYQSVILAAYEQGKTDEIKTDIEKFMISLDPKNSTSIKSLYLLCDYLKLLQLLEQSKSKMSIDFLKWLSNPERFSKYLYTLDKDDDLEESLEIVKTLYENDPKERDTYFKLIVALSVVWDQQRPSIHSQMGPKTLDYSGVSQIQRYEYFKSTYKKGAKISYSKLSIQELIFVVDIPVPLSELEWAKENIKNTIKTWGTLYPGIVYNYNRLKNNQYDWIDGDYKLSEIKKNGGICVDQTYFTIMTARAFGIPAVFFHGVGRNAGERHAWAGYLLGNNEWNLEVGRYSQYNFVTGFAIDPQNNSDMTDHLLGFKCSAEVSKDSYFNSIRANELANFYTNKNKMDEAFYCANLALRLNMFYLPSWDLMQKYYLNKNETFRVVDLLKMKMKTFKDYPDFAYDIGQEAVSLLDSIGKEKDAEDLANLIEKSIKTREDLSEAYVKEKVKELYESGKADDALRVYEKYLSKQAAMYDALGDDIQLYLTYTKQYGQTKRAAVFVRRFIKGARYEKYKEYIAEAYRNNGEDSKAEKIK